MIHQPQKPHCSAVILSGGMNSRMAGRNKAFLKVGKNAILDHLLERLKPNFEEIIIVTRNPASYMHIPVRVVGDLLRARSSLTGIHAGLKHARAEFAFVVPCDTPFLVPAVIKTLLTALDPVDDVVVPLVEGYYEPLCAIYSKRCIPLIEAQLNRGDYKICNLFGQVNVKSLSTEQIKDVDPELISFFNVNTPEAHTVSRDLYQRMRP